MALLYTLPCMHDRRGRSTRWRSIASPFGQRLISQRLSTHSDSPCCTEVTHLVGSAACCHSDCIVASFVRFHGCSGSLLGQLWRGGARPAIILLLLFLLWHSLQIYISYEIHICSAGLCTDAGLPAVLTVWGNGQAGYCQMTMGTPAPH